MGSAGRPASRSRRTRCASGSIATAADGRKIDLVIVSTSEYTPGDVKQNRRSNGFGQINLQTGTEVGLRFSLVKTRGTAGRRVPVTPERVDIALYDLDKGSTRGYETESVTVGSSVAYTVPKVTDLKITNAADTTTVEATKVGKDATPTDPFTLNEDARLATEAQQRVIMFSFSKVSSWDMTFKVTKALGSSPNHRNFMFAGYGVFELPRCTPTVTKPPAKDEKPPATDERPPPAKDETPPATRPPAKDVTPPVKDEKPPANDERPPPAKDECRRRRGRR